MEACIDNTTNVGLDEGIARLLGVTDASHNHIRMTDVRARAARELSTYGKNLKDAFDKLDIRVPAAIQLHSPDEGHVIAIGDHPAVNQITDLINNDLQLLKRFKEVEVLHVLMRRVELRTSGQAMACQHFNIGITSIGCIAFFTEG